MKKNKINRKSAPELKSILNKSDKAPKIKENLILSIKSAGLVENKYKVILNNGDELDNVTEITMGKPQYQDGLEMVIKFFIPNRNFIAEDTKEE